jgi:prepilin-type N-terminal cleavage/methylation domain-containing protein
MTNLRYSDGLSLVEMLIVVGIIALLASLVLTVTFRAENQSKENVLANAFALLENALEQFRSYEYGYPPPYAEFRFPLDCSDFGVGRLQATLAGAVGATAVQISNHDEATTAVCLEYSGCEAMYFLLSQVPEVRQTLNAMSRTLLTNSTPDGRTIEISIEGRPARPLLRVMDPWGTTLRYDYYDVGPTDLAPLPATKRNFPVLTSAGPDKKFGTADDISSRGG